MRDGHARRLPNAFTPLPDDENAILFCFCHPEGFQEDKQPLQSSKPSSAMVKKGKWYSDKGYKDCWGNIWVWDNHKEHWDVQITEKMKNVLDNQDYHLNVEPADKQRANGESILQGSIEHGKGKIQNPEGLDKYRCDDCS